MAGCESSRALQLGLAAIHHRSANIKRMKIEHVRILAEARIISNSFARKHEKGWVYPYRPSLARRHDSTNNRNSALSPRMAGSWSYRRANSSFFHGIVRV